VIQVKRKVDAGVCNTKVGKFWVARHDSKSIKSVCIGKSLGYSKIQFIAHLAIYIPLPLPWPHYNLEKTS